MKSIYLSLAIIGLVVPNYFIFSFIKTHGLDINLFANQLFSNFADSAFSIDLLLCSSFFWYYLFVERSINIRKSIWVYIFLNLTLGLSFAFPLYLYRQCLYNEKKLLV